MPDAYATLAIQKVNKRSPNSQEVQTIGGDKKISNTRQKVLESYGNTANDDSNSFWTVDGREKFSE